MTRYARAIFMGVGVLLVAMMVTSGSMSAYAVDDQPYIGAYGYDGTKVYHADKTYVSSYFFTKTGGTPNQDIISVLSAAGSTSASGNSGVTGFAYQAVTHWDVDGKMWRDPQVWGPNSAQGTIFSQRWSQTQNTQIPQSQLKNVVMQAIWSSSRTSITFQDTFVKTDLSSVVFPSTYSKVSWDQSTYFLAGKCTGSACYSGNIGHTDFFQWGVESPLETTYFKVQQRFPKIWDTYAGDVSSAQWIQFNKKNANAIYGGGNALTWWMDYTFGSPPFEHEVPVGGYAYPHVKPIVTIPSGGYPYVQWNQQTCNPPQCVSNDSPLW